MKTIIKLIAVTALLSSSLMADFIRLEMGAGTWMATPSGEVSYSSNGATAKDTSSENEETNIYVWALVKHPLPIIPNLRLEYVGVKTAGVANGKFKEFETGLNSKTNLEMTQLDIIPYYNILDNTAWITLDLGIDIKIINMSYEVNGVIGKNNTFSDDTSIPLPLLYARTRVEIPFTGVGLEADVKYMKYSISRIYDARAKVDYTFNITPLIQPSVEVGYRIQKYEIDESSVDGLIDLEFSGLYAGVMLRF